MDDLSPEEMDKLSKAMGNVEEPEPTQEAATAVQEEEPRAPVQAEEPAPSTPLGRGITKAQFMQLEEAAQAAGLPAHDLDRMHDVQVHVEVILGTTKMPLEKILQLHPGGVIELDKLAGEPVDIVINSRLVARAEVVVVDELFGVKILEIVGTKQKLSALQAEG